MDTVRYAIVGCGSVSAGRYFRHADAMTVAGGKMVGVCDLVEERVRPRAEQFGVPYYLDFDRMLDELDFDLLVNITNIQSHYALNLKGLRAGRHVYTQKPMTITVEEATTLIDEAAKRDLKLVAEEAAPVFPDIRTVRKLLDEGVIGKVMWMRSACTHYGPASTWDWTTDPTWFYLKGAGPVRDVGVERLHLLTTLLGPAKRVAAMSGLNQPEVLVRSGTSKGKRIQVEEDDITMIVLDFGDSIFAMLDVVQNNIDHNVFHTPHYEIYGQKGVITQRRGDRPLELYREEPELGIRGWEEVSLIPSEKPDPPQAVAGLVHAIECILEDKRPVASGEHARHCIEIIEKAYTAARTGMTQDVETRF